MNTLIGRYDEDDNNDRSDGPEHRQYHLEVSLEDCGVPGCTVDRALAIHFQALREGEE